MLFGVLSGSCQPFFAVRRDKADRQPGFLYHIGYAALGGARAQPTQQRILATELCQSAFQIGVEGVDADSVFRFVPVDNGFFLILRQLVIKCLLKVSVFSLPSADTSLPVILCHLHAELLIKARIPVFLNLIFHLSGKSQHPAFCFWINSQCGQPFEPCHGVVGDWDRAKA